MAGRGDCTEWRDGVRRSARLFRAFLTEQTDPDGFYTLIADDTLHLVQKHEALVDRTVLDVGGGPGYYTRAFRSAGARCLLVDVDPAELHARGGRADRAAVLGDAASLPLRCDSVDVAFSSNLLEHVGKPWRVCEELARVVRPGGLLVLSYTIWLGPWGGHETSPWHYLGGHYAARRYRRRHGRDPKNVFGTGMFAISASAGIQWAHRAPGLDLLELRPRYLPPSTWWVLRVAGLRELAAWNLWMVFRKR